MNLKEITLLNLPEVLHTIALRYFVRKRLPKGHIGEGSVIHTPSNVAEGSLEKMFIGKDCHIDWGSTLYCNGGKFIMKDHSTASVGFTVVTGNHRGAVGEYQMQGTNDNLVGKDIVIGEDVWIGANVTLLAGADIGRGAIVGAGSVVPDKSVPPYSIVAGVPCKIIGWRFSKEEIIEHEKKLYAKDMRMTESEIEKILTSKIEKNEKIKNAPPIWAKAFMAHRANPFFSYTLLCA